jgi:hypothetical protein
MIPRTRTRRPACLKRIGPGSTMVCKKGNWDNGVEYPGSRPTSIVAIRGRVFCNFCSTFNAREARCPTWNTQCPAHQSGGLDSQGGLNSIQIRTLSSSTS